MAVEAGGELEVHELVLLDLRLLRICGNSARTGQDNAFFSDAPWQGYFNSLPLSGKNLL
jgi:hypothetical protein